MRLKNLSIIITVMFSVLLAGLFWTQVIRGGHYYALSQNNRIRLVSQEAPRGKIFDSNDRVIADSILSYNLVIKSQELKNKRQRLTAFDKLSPALGGSVESLEAIYKRNYIAPFADTPVAENINRELAFKLEQMNLDVPEAAVKTTPQRRYLYKEATAPILGYLGEIDKEQLLALKEYGYRQRDIVGKSGLEKTLDRILRGEDGGMQIEVNNRGYKEAVLSSKEPKAGKDVRLTINIDIQQYAYDLLDGRKGAIVVLNPQDGSVISMVSSPSFDPHIFFSAERRYAIKTLFSDESAPLLNRAVQSEYTPGSIFKIVTVTAGLETGKISSGTTFFCPGFYFLGRRRFGCWQKKGHGRLDLKGAIQHSCNVYFFRAGHKIQQEALAYYARMFGLGRRTGIDLAGEAKGFVPDKNWKRRIVGENWYDGDTLNLSIGQGYVLMTPLQAAVMVSVIANNGKLIQPYVVESVAGVKVGLPHIRAMPISSNETIQIIKKGLNMAVESPGGTGIWARVDGLNVSGKTGTAQIMNDSPHAWFVGYAPAEEPKAAIAVFLENGGYGGETAAPIAGAIFKKMKQLGML